MEALAQISRIENPQKNVVLASGLSVPRVTE